MVVRRPATTAMAAVMAASVRSAAPLCKAAKFVKLIRVLTQPGAQPTAHWPQHHRGYSAIFPRWGSLIKKCPDAFLSIAGQQVLDHHVGGVLIGLSKPHFALAIECFFADFHYQA